MPCLLCRRLDRVQAGRTYAHHIRTGQGKGQRSPHYRALPLCYECHQGDEGLHGTRALWRVAGCEELDILDDVIAELSARLDKFEGLAR